MASSMQLGIFTQKVLENSPTIAYTVPAGKTLVLKTISLCNTTTTSDTVTVWIVSSSDEPAAKNMIINALTVEAGDTQLINLDIYPSAGYKVVMKTELGTSISMTMSGVLLTSAEE